MKVPIAGLISKKYADELRKGISMEAVGTKIPAGNPLPFVGSGGTSHLSVIDKQGNIVALTQTINYFFGSGVLVPGTGIMLNNEMDDFNPQPGTSNSVEPKKRPLSSMTPTIMLKNGKPFMSVGSPGATRIISALTQIIVNVVDFRMNLQDAIEAARIHCMTGDIFMESRIPKATQDALTAKGHKLNVRGEMDLYFGGAQGVMIAPASACSTERAIRGATARPWGTEMLSEPMILLIMVAVFVGGCFLAKLPVALSLVLASIAGALAGGEGVPLRHLVEGTFGFLDTIVVIAGAMIYMKVLQHTGVMDTLGRQITEAFYDRPSLLLVALMVLIMFPGMITGSSTACVFTTGAMVAPVLVDPASRG